MRLGTLLGAAARVSMRSFCTLGIITGHMTTFVEMSHPVLEIGGMPMSLGAIEAPSVQRAEDGDVSKLHGGMLTAQDSAELTGSLKVRQSYLHLS